MADKKVEVFIMKATGKILIVAGVLGIIFTMRFDTLAGRAVEQIGSLAMLGLCVSIGLIVYGVVVDGFLKTVKDLLD